MKISATKAVPITILTGFLGAGKTTLLNRILSGDHGLRVAVLVNDFGAVNIDAELVLGIQDDVISLNNGCVCCTIRDDLVETVQQTINRPEAPEYILLEASGVADPLGIALTFVNPNLRDHIRLDSVTCVVDADQVFANPELPALIALKLRQVAYSDMVILNKVDLAGPEQVKKVRAWIDGNFRRRRIVETHHCDVPLEILLSVGRFGPAQSGLDRHALEHAGCADEKCKDDHDTSIRMIEPPLCVRRAKGAYLWDEDGKRYIDYHAAFVPASRGVRAFRRRSSHNRTRAAGARQAEVFTSRDGAKPS